MSTLPPPICYSGYIGQIFRKRRGPRVAPFVFLGESQGKWGKEDLGEEDMGRSGKGNRDVKVQERVEVQKAVEFHKNARWEKFKTYKQRGEWVELLFMAAAALHGYHVLKPNGDNLPYDVGIEQSGGLLRVQVKCSSHRRGGGYVGHLQRGANDEGYDSAEVDLFALYILQPQIWYLIPAQRVLHPKPKLQIRFYPEAPPRPGRRTPDHDYEPYREAWGLLGKDRRELAAGR